jgi:N-acetylmuramoyl-L-alanine amidase
MNKPPLITNPWSLLATVIITFIYLVSNTVTGYALPAEQKRAQDIGAGWFNVAEDSTCRAGAGSTTLSGTDNVASIFNYLVGKGLSDFQAAGIMGNMHDESGFNPRRVQSTPTPSGDLDSPPSGAIGYGLVQWTPGDQLIGPAANAGKIPGDLGFQLDYLWSVLQGPYKKVLSDLQASTDVIGATTVFELQYEKHDGPPQPQRAVEAQKVLDLVQAGGIPATSTAGTSNPTSTTGAPSIGTKPVIALDPGHGGLQKQDHVDPATGLHDGDYPNQPEMEVVFDVATRAKAKLEQAGYQVVMTKPNVNDQVWLRDRSNVANNAKAALAVSIHTEGDHAFGTWQQIYTQKVGLYRGAGANRQTFSDQALADKSKSAADLMKISRDTTESVNGPTTEIKDNTFGGDKEPGNIPMVQLFSTVPWIYLEAGGGATNEGLNDQQKEIYATSIVNGIEKAVPATPVAASDGCNSSGAGGGVVAGNIVQTAVNLSWADGQKHGSQQADANPAYQTAMPQYNGSVGTNPFSDCGVFVATVMVASGADPNYTKRVTGEQIKYLSSHPEKYDKITDNVASTSELQPGDILIYSNGSKGHTALYIGPQPGGYNMAEASLNDNVPEQKNFWEANQNFSVFRLKT